MTDRPDPFTEIEQFVDEFVQFGGSIHGDVPIDVVDADDEIVVVADLPGRESEAIDVQLEENRQLRVEAGAMETDHDGRYVTRERSTDAVERSVRLPAAVDEEGTEASYDRGVLTIRLPKLSGSGDGTDIPVN
jgi:HSP20 family protein